MTGDRPFTSAMRRSGCPILAALAAGLFALAPVEGYLLWLHPQLAKVPAIVLCGAWLILRRHLEPTPRIHVVYVLLATMAAIVLVSTALHLGAPFATLYAARWIPFLIITAVLVDVASTQVSIRLLLASTVVGATVVSIGALISVLVLHEPRATGPNLDPNDLACTLVATLPLVLTLSPRHVVARAGVVLAVAAMTLAAVATLSRGAMVSLAAVVAWVVLRRAVPVRASLCAGALAIFVGAMVACFARADLLRALAQKQFIGEKNIDVRLLRWHAALRMLAQQPVLGEGPGGFRSHYAGVSNLAEIDVPAQQVVAHNTYLEVGAELGVLGLITLLALIATAFVSAETALSQGVDRRVVVGVQASLIGVVVAVFFVSGEYFFSLWSIIAVGCAVGIRAQYREEV